MHDEACAAAHGDVALPPDPRRLVLVFASPVAAETAALAGRLGWAVTVLDPDAARLAGLADAVASVAAARLDGGCDVVVCDLERPELGEELTNSFCRADPEIASRFARATFLSDNRADLARVRTPSLILQCSDDVIAPEAVGDYVHAQLAGSRLVHLEATGHCPNLSAPDETAAAIRAYLSE